MVFSGAVVMTKAKPVGLDQKLFAPEFPRI